jgi:hypothetical protein
MINVRTSPRVVVRLRPQRQQRLPRLFSRVEVPVQRVWPRIEMTVGSILGHIDKRPAAGGVLVDRLIRHAEASRGNEAAMSAARGYVQVRAPFGASGLAAPAEVSVRSHLSSLARGPRITARSDSAACHPLGRSALRMNQHLFDR